MEIGQLAERFGVNAEEGAGGYFPCFLRRATGKRLLILTDETTLPLSASLQEVLRAEGTAFSVFCLPEREPVADIPTVERVVRAASSCDLLLAVGAGTLNDLCKRAGFLLGKPSAVLATAPSMDGYASGVTPLIENGFKITRQAQLAGDILLDYGLLSSAPSLMIGAGVGDILAKHCSLADWRLGAAMTGERHDAEAAGLTAEALKRCEESVPQLLGKETNERERGVRALTEALLVSGFAMAIAGNSRPASGAEHHMSHFLEMDFLARGERIPLHGIKVGLGTAVSLYLYRTLRARTERREFFCAYEEAERLPSSDYVLDLLEKFGCPTRFSALEVSRETVRRMLFEAYRIRDRFTILTLYCKYGLMEKTADELLERFY